MVAGTSKLASLPVTLPTTPLSKDVNVHDISRQFEGLFSVITDSSTFTHDAIWRDTFALTGTFRTFYSAEGVTKAWQGACLESARLIDGTLTMLHDKAMVMSLPDGSNWVEITGSFATRTSNGLTAQCSLMIGVVPGHEEEKWKVWSMRTVLEEIEGWPSVDRYAPKVNGTVNGEFASGSLDTNGTEAGNAVAYHDVVVVGGGQAGLSVAGRLQALGVDYVLLDKYKQIGDSWSSRYDSARLHTIREYSHLPFDRTFPKDKYQEFLTKDDLARGYRDWAKKFGIVDHIWTETELKSGAWEQDIPEWTLCILKQGRKENVRCRFVVLAIGAGGQIPYMPDLPGKDEFKGVVVHSQQYLNAKAWKGKRGIVVGSANTAHDIAEDMLDASLASTTMVQRSPTYVLPYEYWQKVSSRTYNENFPTELADKLQMTGPAAVGRLLINSALHAMASEEPERFEALERAGFRTVRYGDLMWNLTERKGGHYMDIGTSRKIADGKVSMWLICRNGGN